MKSFCFNVVEHKEKHILIISNADEDTNRKNELYEYEFYIEDEKIIDNPRSENVVIFNKNMRPRVCSRITIGYIKEELGKPYQLSITGYDGGCFPVIKIITPDGISLEIICDKGV